MLELGDDVAAAAVSWWRIVVRSGGDGEVGEAPLEHAVGQAHGGVAVLGEHPYRLVGQHAVGAATVGDDVVVVRQFGEMLGEFIEGNRYCGGDVAGRVFLARAHIDHRDLSGLYPFE